MELPTTYMHLEQDHPVKLKKALVLAIILKKGNSANLDSDVCLNFLRHELLESCAEIHHILPHFILRTTLISRALMHVLINSIKNLIHVLHPQNLSTYKHNKDHYFNAGHININTRTKVAHTELVSSHTLIQVPKYFKNARTIQP